MLDGSKADSKSRGLQTQFSSCTIILLVIGNAKLLKIPGGTLLWAIQTHRKLLKVAHLIPENCIVGHQDVVPGLISPKQKDNGQWHLSCVVCPVV